MLNFRALLVFLAITVSLGLAGQLTPGTISISGVSTVCSGSTHGVLTSTVPTNTTGNVTYQWKSSTSANGTYSNVASTGLTYSPSTNITADIYYKLYATDDISTVASSAFAVLVHDAPTLNISSSPSGNVPPAASVSLSALLTNVPTGYNYSYLWSTGGTSNTVTVTPSVTTSYTVTVTDQYTCATATSASVTVAALSGGQIASADLTVCTGDAPGAMTSTSGASGGTGSGYTYQWEKSTTNNSSGFANITGATSATYTFSNVISQTTWVRRKTTNAGVDAYSNVLQFTLDPLPNAAATASPSTVVSGGSSNLLATGGTSYSWAAPVSSTSATVTVSNITAQTTYTVTVTDGNNCSKDASVTVNVATLVAGVIATDQDVCQNATPATITSSSAASGGSGNYTYAWEKTASLAGSPTWSTVSGQSGTTLGFSSSISATEYYRRKATDASGGSAVYSNVITLTYRALPTVTLAASPTGNVPEGGSVQLTATVGGSGNTFLWNPGSATTNPVTVTPSSTTAYNVTVTDQYSCSNTAASAKTVTVVPIVPGVIASATNSFCTGAAPGAMTSTSGASGGTGSGYTYQWEKSTTNNSSGFANITGATSATFTPSATATATTWFRRKVTNYNVDAYSNVLQFTVNALPNAAATASPSTVVSGGSSNLLATGGTSYLWSTSATTAAVTVSNITAQTTYTVTVTDGNNCSKDASVTVNVATLVAGVIATDQDVCQNATPATITSSSAASGGSGNYTYAWEKTASLAGSPTWSTVSGQSGTTLGFSSSISATEYYRRKATDASGGSAVYSNVITLTYRALPTVTLAASPTGNVPEGGSVQLTATVGGSGNTFLWNPGSATTNPVTVTPSSTTAYNVTVTDQYSCSNTAASAKTVTVVPIVPGVIASATNSFCTGAAPGAMTSTSGASGGTGSGYTYQWEKSTTNNSSGFANITGATSATFTPSATATATTWFRRKVTNYNVDAYSNVLQFTVNALPNAAATASPSTVVSGGSSNLLATGGTSYLWSTSATTAAVTVSNITAQTTYTVTVTDGNNCSKDASVTVNVATLVAGVIATDQDVCQNATPATITSSSAASGGSGNYTYAWEKTASLAGSPTWSTVSGQSGTTLGFSSSISATEYYRRKATDASGGSAVYSNVITLTYRALPTVTLAASPTGNVPEGGSVQLTATVGGSGNTFLWNPGSATTNPVTVTPSSTTAYNVTVTDQYSCSNTAASAKTVTVVPIVPGVIASATNSFCTGAAPGAMTSTSGASGGTGSGYTYQWEKSTTNNSSGFANITGATSATFTPSATATATTWFRRKVTNYNVDAYSNVLQFTVNALPNAAATASPSTVVSGGSSNLLATGGTSYLWSTSATTAAVTVSNITAQTTYTVTVTDGNNCSKDASVTVNVATLVAGVIATDQDVCQNATPATITSSSAASGGSGNYTYAWEKTASLAGSPTWSTVSGQSGTTLGFSSSISATEYYRRKATDASGGSAVYSNVITLTYRALPTVTLAASPTGNVPEGGSVQLTATVGGSGNTFLWNPGSATTNPVTVTPSSTTAYNVTVTDQYSCSNTAASAKTVTVVPIVPGVIASATNSFCTGAAPGAMTSTSGASGGTGSGYTYQWEKSTTNNSSGFANITGATSATFTPSATATATTWFRRKVTNYNVDAYSNVLQFTVNALPNAAATASPSTVVSGGSSNLLATGGTSYLWSTSATTAAVTVSNITAQTTYTVTVTDGNNCSKDASVTVNVATLVAGVIATDQDVCQNATPATITSSSAASGGSGNYTYAWEKTASLAGSPTWSTVSGQSGTTLGFSSSISATEYYRRKATDASGGSAVYSNVITLTYRALPTVTLAASPTGNVPEGGSVQLTATVGGSGNTFLWNPGSATTNPVTVTPSSTTAYNVTVTDQYSCSNTAASAKTVTVVPIVPGVIASATNSFCTGAAPGAMTSTSGASGGTGSGYTYQWEKSTTNNSSGFANITGATSATFTPSATATATTWFRRKVTNYNVDAYSNVLQFTVNALPNAAATASPSTVVSGGSSNLSATGGTSYSWAAPVSSTSATVTVSNITAQTTYTVTVTDGNNCSKDASVTVNVATLVAGVIATDQDVCQNATPATITSSSAASGGSGNYTYAWEVDDNSAFDTPSTVSGQSGTTLGFSSSISATEYYRRKATDASGGSAVYSNVITLTYRALPTVTLAASPTGNVPEGGSVQLTATVGGSGNTFLWNPGSATTNPVTVTPSSTTAYNVTVTDQYSCSNTAASAKTVTVVPIVPGVIASATNSFCTGAAPGAMTSTSGASGGTGSGYTYQWEKSTTNNSSGFANITGATSATFTPSATATATTWFRRKVTNYNVDAYSNVLQFTVNALPNAAATASPSTVVSGGSSNLLATGGTSYLWSTSATTAAVTVSNITAQTTYTVTVTDGNNCSKDASVTVNVATLVAGVIATDQDVCQNATPATITSSSAASGGSGNYTYAWEKTASLAGSPTWSTVSGQSGTTLGFSSSISATEYYRRKATDASGGSAVYSNVITLTYRALPTVTLAASPTGNVPEGGSVQLTATVGGSGNTFLWNPGSATTNPVTVTPSSTTAYNVTVTDQYSCSNTAASAKTVTVVPIVPGVIASATNSFCTGAAPGAMTSTSGASGGTGSGYTYQWEKSTTNNSSGFANITGATSATFTPSATATATTWFRRKVTNYNVDAYSNVLQFTVTALPNVAATASPSTVPSGGTTTLTGSNASTYAWSGDATLSSSTGSTVTANPTGTTTYTVVGTDVNNCQGTATVTVSVQSILPGTIASDETVCAGINPSTITGTLPTGGSGGSFTYKWQKSTNLSGAWSDIASSDTKDLSFSAAITQTTYYRRGAADASDPTNFVFSDYKTKTFKALPTISISRTPTGNVPPGANVAFTGAGAGSGGTYSWSFGSSSNPATSAVNSTSTINVTGTDEDGCQNTASESVTAVALVTGTITSATNIVCTGDIPGALTQAVAASGGAGSGYTYSWYKKIGSGSYSLISGATTATYTPTATVTSTTYFRRDITNLGVTVQGTPFMFTVSTLPSISIASTASTVSSGTSVTLTSTVSTSPASSSQTYLWSTGASTANITVTPVSTTVYTLTVTDDDNCVNSESATITVNALTPGTISASGSNDFCSGDSPSTMTLSGTSGGSGSYTYQWQESSNNSTFSNVGSATSTTYSPGAKTALVYYRCKITDANNSSSIDYSNTLTRNVNAVPTISATVSLNRPIALGGSIAVKGSGASNYNYQFESSGSVDQTYASSSGSNSDSKTYTPQNVTPIIVTVKGKSANGCVGQDTSVVYASALVAGTVTNPNSAICEGTAMPNPITGAVSTGGSKTYTYQWQYSTNNSSWNNISNSNSKDLNYSVVLNVSTYFRRQTTDQGFTIVGNSVLQTVNSEPSSTITTSYTSSTGHMPDGATIVLTAPAGLAGYSWTPISGSNNTLSVNPTVSTTYNVTVTDANGCTNTDSKYISIDNLRPGTLSNQSICDGSSPVQINASNDGGGSGIYTFSWELSTDQNTWSSISGVTTSSYTSTPAPSVTSYYRRTITDHNVTKTSTSTVIVSSNPTVYPDKRAVTIPFGGSTTITVYGANSYSWTDGSSTWSGSQYTASPSVTTTYTVTGTDVNGCEDTTQSVVTVASFTAGDIGSDQTICSGDTPSLLTSVQDATGGSGSITYSWESSPDGTSSWSQIGSANQKTYQPPALSVDKYYRRKATSSSVTVTTSTVVYIKVTQGPTTTVSAIRTRIAKGDTTTLTGAGADSYSWTPTGYVIAASGTTASIKPSATATFTVTGTTTGCSSNATQEITVSELSAGTIASNGSTSICPGVTPSSMSFTAAPSNGSLSYSLQWQISTNNINWTNIPNATANTYAPPNPIATSTWYRCQVNDPGISVKPIGVLKYTNAVQYSVTVPTTLSVVATYDTIPPSGTGNVLSVSGGTTSTFKWYVGSISGTPAATNVSTYTPTNNSSETTFHLQYTDSGCLTSVSKTIYVDALNAGTIGTDQDVCDGATSVNALTSTTGASGGTQGSYSYQWEQSSDQTNWSDISGATNATFTPSFPSGFTQTKYYRRKVTNAGVQAVTSLPVTLSKVIRPTLSITAAAASNSSLSASAPVIPNGATINLNSQASNGNVVSYSWSPSAGLSATNTASVQASPTSTTAYSLNAVTDVGCTQTVQITVTVNELTPGTIEIFDGTAAASSMTICPGEAPPANSTIRPKTSGGTPTGGSGAYTYQWEYSTDQTTWTTITSSDNSSADLSTYSLNSTFDNVTATRYYRRKASNTGVVKASDVVQLNVYNAPNILITSTSDTIPPGGTNNLAASGGGAGTYANYEWHLGSIGASPATGTNYGINGSSGNSQTTQMTYVLRGSDANCSNTFTKTIYIDPIDAGSITGDQNICENSTSASVLSNAVVASGGTQGSYLYQWYKRVGLGGSYATIPGANTASYTPSFSSASDNIFYKRQVTNAGITAFSNEVVLTLVTNPVISVAATGQSGSTISIPIGASIQLNATATGQPISSYAWTPPTALNTTSGASVISTPNSSIVYTVTGTNASSCEATGQITVNATNLNAGTVESSSSSSQNEAICPGAVPSVMQPAGSSVPSGGSGSYTYQWQRSSDNISWTDITALNNTSFSNATYTPNITYDTLNSPRFYRRKVTDMSVNAYSNAINITINQLPTIVASASKNSVPVGGNVVLSGSGAANANSYTWYKQGSQISTSQNPTVSVPVTSRYVVYGVGSNGCGDSSAVNVAAVALTAGGVGPDQTICAGESAATINSTSLPTGGSGNYTYKWFKTTDLNVAFSEITGATQTSYTPSISTTTYFKRKVTDSDISEETSVVTINVVPKPTVSAIASSRYMPPGGTQTLSASGASTYTWSPTVTGLNPAKSQVSITGAGAGTTTYTAQGTDINGCTGSDTVNIYVRNITTGTIGSNQTLCEGAIPASITGTASSGGSGVFTYQWQKSSDNLAWSDINGEVAQNLVFSSSSTTTTYYRRKTIDQSAEALTNTIIINVNPKPILTIATDSGDSLLCQGNSMILTANGATTYSWTLGSTALGSTQAITVSPTATTTYDVTGTSAQGCVSAPASIPISVTPAPVVLVSTDYSQIPPGATVNLTASGASTYAWSPNTGLSSATNPIITATPTSTTRYVVTGTSASGCSDTISQLIKVIPLDGGTITASKSVCSGDTVGTILEVSSSQGGTGSGFTYEWEKSSDNINWTAITNTNNASVVLSEVITQTTYFRRKSNNLSVSAYSNISTVQAISRPTVVLSSNKSTAPRGGNVTFSGSGAATYDLKLNGSSISTSLPYQTQVFSTATYYLEGTDANGCVDTTGLLITVDPLQPGTIGPDQAFCAGSTFNTIQNLTSPSGGSSVYTYQWESSIDGSNYSVIPNTNSLNYTPGILQVTTYFRRRVTDSDLDTITAVATLTVHSDPQVSATASAKTVPPGASITLNGTGAATYIWSGAQSSNLSSTSGSPVTALINASTTYTVTGTDVNGCQDTGVISITVVPINPGTTDASSTVCVGEVPPQIFSITLASGGSGNFSYEWETSSDGVTWSAISGANGTNFTPVNAANATVFYRRVAVNLGVKEPANAVTVTTLNRPSITGSTNLGTIPPGASAILSAQGVNAQGSYDWSVNASSIASTQTVTVTPSNTTNYILTGTDANNCSNTDTVTVSVVPLDGGVITAFPASLCEGEALDSIVSTSLASGGSGVYAYTWEESTDNTNWTAIPNQFGAKLYYAPLITQTKYFRRITTDNGIEAFSNIASVTMNSNPLVQANSLSGRYLPFGAQVSLEGSQGLVTYSWSPTNVLNSSNTRTTSGTLNSTTIFTLDAIDANGCSGQDTIKIFARTLNPGTIGADQIICANEQPNPFTSITSASGGSETFTYKWQDSVATGNWVDILGAVATGYTPGPVATTKFYRRVVIDNSIEKASNIITITVATNPADVVTSDTTVCQGSDPISLSIMATAAPGHTLNWYSSLTGGVGSAVTPTYTPAAVGTTDYFVSQKNNSNGCESSRKKVIMETAVLPSQPTATTNVNYCLGEANPAALSATPSVGTNVIRWYDSDGITRLLTAPTPNTSDAGNKKYYASEYNSTTGCESSPVEITVIVYQPTATATTTQDVSCFGGSDGQVTGLGSAGLAPYNYTWKNSAGQVIGIQSFAAGLTSDNYVVIVEDARGCQDSAGVTVSEPTQLIISSTKQDPQCYGDNGSITLTATGGTPIYNYSFDNGVTYQTSNTKSLPFGQYRMKVRDSKMCEVTDTANPVALNQTTAIAASLTETSVSCNNGLDGKLLAIASGGSPGLSGYQYQWNDPNLQATDSAVGLSAGSYTVTISDQYGCSRNFTKAVNEPDAVIVSDISSTNLKCFESADGSIEITAQGGNALEYSIDNGVTYLPSSTFPNLTVGSYRVVVQDSLNCLVTYNAVRQITLTQPDRIEVQDIVMDSASCNGYSDAQVQIFATGGSEKKYSINGGNFFNNSGLFTGLSSGYYNAVVTDSNNCIATYNTGVSSSGSIQDPDLLYMSGISVTDLSCNNSSDGEIEVIASGGTNRKYSLDAGANYQSSPIFTGLDAGTYTVTLSDANNCPATYALSRTVTILEPDPVVVDSVIEIQPSCNGASNGSITINASGGNDLSYSIDNGVNTQPGDYFPFLPAGNYQITVSDSKSCLVTYNIPTRAVLLSEPDSVIVQDILAEGITCNDASDGSIEIVAGGGNILEYSINNGATYFPTSIFTGLDKGTYQTKVRDSKSCQVFYEVNRVVILTEPDSLFIDSISSNNVTCKNFNNGNIEIFASGGNAPLQYSITRNKPSTFIQQNYFDLLTPGIYETGINDALSCPAYSRVLRNITITEPDQLKVDAIDKEEVTCNSFDDGIIELSVSGGTISYDYKLTSDTDTINQNQPVFIGLSANTYTISVIDSFACPLTYSPGLSQAVKIDQPDTIIVRQINPTDITCNNFNDGKIEIIATGGNDPLEYSIDFGASYFLANEFNNLVAGVYNINVSDSNNCPVVQTPVSVDSMSTRIINPLPIQASSSVTNNLCKADQLGIIDLVISGGTVDTITDYIVTWTDVNSNIVGYGLPIDSLGAGVYISTIEDNNLCLTSISTTITEPDSLLISSITHKDLKCFRSIDGEINISTNGGTGPLYSIDSGLTYLSSGAFAGLDTGTYFVNVTDVNSCISYPTGMTQIQIMQPDSFYVDSVVIEDVDCFGNNTGAILISANGGNSLSYSIDGGLTIADSAFFDSLYAGSYTVQVVDSAGCQGTNSSNNIVDVLEPSLLQASATTILGTKCEIDTTGGATITPTGGVTPYQIIWETFDSTFTITGLNGFEYLYTVADSNLCLFEGVVKIPTTDADCDSIPDIVEGIDDIDNDGLPNYRDRDSDGDKLPDLIEIDANRDGIPAYGELNLQLYDNCDSLDEYNNFGPLGLVPNFLDPEACDTVLFLPGVFTPNGDGKNDKLVFPGIESYEQTTLTLFNRNGEIVFQKSPYDNSFDGTSSRTVFLNNNRDNYLPTGTYFYTLVIEDLLSEFPEQARMQGYIYIQR